MEVGWIKEPLSSPHSGVNLEAVHLESLTVHLVLVSHPPDSAAELARGLVEEGLAACVNIMPGSRSIYRWEDKTCETEEVILTIKTAREPIEELIKTIARRHPHECPEVIVIPVTTGLDRYMQWVEKMSGKKEAL